MKEDRNLVERVKESIKWHKSPKECAKRLGIAEEEYIRVRKIANKERKEERITSQLIDLPSSQYDSGYNLEKGEGRISGVCNHEPKSSKEIIKLLKIDTEKWKLSAYWNKQMGDHWRISALVTLIKQKEEFYLKNLVENWKPKIYKFPKVIKQDKKKPRVGAVLSIQDIHFGKEGNDTIDKDFEETIISLLNRAAQAHHISDIFFVLGGDLINMDTFDGSTTKGTPVENSCKATEAYIQAFNAMHWAIIYTKRFCNKLTVVYIPGNHDRLSSFHLAHALSKSIKDKGIVWDVEYLERKVHKWYNNFNAFEHGDVSSKNTPLIYATDFSEEWGTTKNRTLFTGHKHTEQKIEYITKGEKIGFVHKTLPSLSTTDYWHYHKKFIGNRRAGIMELQDARKGNICELIHLLD